MNLLEEVGWPMSTATTVSSVIRHIGFQRGVMVARCSLLGLPAQSTARIRQLRNL